MCVFWLVVCRMWEKEYPCGGFIQGKLWFNGSLVPDGREEEGCCV